MAGRRPGGPEVWVTLVRPARRTAWSIRSASSEGAAWARSGDSSTWSSARWYTAKWWRSVIGRRSSTTTSTGPRTERSQAPSSLALDTVAERQTKVTLAGREDEHLLPHPAPVGVLEVVDLVEDDRAPSRCSRSEPASSMLRRTSVVMTTIGGSRPDGGVAGQEPDLFLAVGDAQVAELLVGERLERRRVEDLRPLGERAGGSRTRRPGSSPNRWGPRRGPSCPSRGRRTPRAGTGRAGSGAPRGSAAGAAPRRPSSVRRRSPLNARAACRWRWRGSRRTTSGTSRTSIESGSALGVKIADRSVSPMIAQRHACSSWAGVSTPASWRPTRTTGNSKVSPNRNIMSRIRLRYSLGERIWCRLGPPTCRRNVERVREDDVGQRAAGEEQHHRDERRRAPRSASRSGAARG